MDQVQIGKFIAQRRRAGQMTQRQLADALSISDKTVSKWECGKGLPEVALMLPLCGILGITVNELLAGETLSASEYQRKAEENMVNLIQENQQNRERMALSVICGVITVIAVCALTVIASYCPLPVAGRIGIVALALATAVAGVGAAARLEVKAGYYECPYCGALFVPTMGEYVKGYHTLTRRRLTCHSCGKTGMCRHRVVRR